MQRSPDSDNKDSTRDDGKDQKESEPEDKIYAFVMRAFVAISLVAALAFLISCIRKRQLRKRANDDFAATHMPDSGKDTNSSKKASLSLEKNIVQNVKPSNQTQIKLDQDDESQAENIKQRIKEM